MHKKQKQSGFSLVELLIYIAIFVTSSTFLIAILTTVTRVQLRQTSVNTVNRQITFVTQTIQRLVQESSVIQMDAGVPGSTLILRMPTQANDLTEVYVTEDGRLFKRETSVGGNEVVTALTEPNIRVITFEITKFENPGGRAIVQAAIGLSYDTDSERARFSRSVETAITRVSAASFDTDIIPASGGEGILDIGASGTKWNNGYFSGSVGIGVDPGANSKLTVSGDIELTANDGGIRIKSSGGACYRLTVDDNGIVVTTPC